jgi:thermitase
MKKTIILSLSVIAILLISLLPTIASADSPGNPAPGSVCCPDQILVSFEPGTSRPVAARIHRGLGGQVKETIPGIGVQVITVPQGRAMAMDKAYSSNPKVAYAEPDFLVQAVGEPDDRYFYRQYGLTLVGAPLAWEVTTGSPSINIAILDTGVDQDHPDLAAKIVSNINLTSSPSVDDVQGHGTHVAGIAAAITDNGIGVAGLGYDSSIMNVKVMNDSGFGTYGGVASGIIWAADNGADVISMSLGAYVYSSTLEDAVNYAWSKGAVLVAAAGNEGRSTPFYPAAHANCIAVAATTSLDTKASFSNYGDWVDVGAPGTSIYSTRKDNSYGYGAGTSMAAPYVGGLAGLVFTTVSDTNGDGKLNDEVRSRIEATCDDIGETGIGHGRINAARAVGDGAPVLPGSISGQVTDTENGSAISGAQVTDGTRTATTDATGEYTIADVPAGGYEVTASKEGYQSASLTVNVISGGTSTANIPLNEVVLPGSITGSVTDAETGSPIAGATVSDGTRTAATDTSGEYTLADVPEGTYQVTASKEGYESSSVTMNVISGDTAVANLSLNEVALPGSITGAVTDAETGSAIAGATVTDGTRTATTDTMGEYTIADVPEGIHQVTASEEGYESSSVTVNVISGDTAVANLSLNEVVLPGSITGSVTDVETGSAITGATVTDGTRTATTDTSGGYTIDDVPAGSYEVTASKSGYESSMSTVTVVSGESAVMNFTLNPEAAPGDTMWVSRICFSKFVGNNLFVQVSVVSAGGLVVGADVDLALTCSTGELWNFSGTTNSAGYVTFKLGKAPVGSYTATVTGLARSGFTWDMTKGVIATCYTLSN